MNPAAGAATLRPMPLIRARAGASAPASLATCALLAGCSAGPPPPPIVVIVVPTSSPSVASAEPAIAPPRSCPKGMAFLAGGDLRAGGRGVKLPDLCIDATEVTAGAYAECVEHNQCTAEGLVCDDAPTWGRAELADHPINCVTWQQADAYCRSAGKRLPTREEWEWAAQSRDEGRRFAWGATEPAADQLCWSRGSARAGTCAVGEFPGSRTPGGVDDLFGGVWEWLSPAERNGTPNIARGGSWQNDATDTLEGDNAGSFLPGFTRNDVVGFRCVADPLKP